jgi:predicted membrane chloride channel (bestrophin family)
MYQPTAVSLRVHLTYGTFAYMAALCKQQCVDQQDSGVLSGSVSGSCDAKVSSMLQALGSCTRIKHTPMPFAYIVHLR